MKTEKNILIACILNLCFSVFELFGGIFTGSVAIVSDAVHDIGDAASIGVSFFLERKSKKEPNETYTYGYARYSVIGGAATNLVLLFGSATVVVQAIRRLIQPVPIHDDGMILFAVVGAMVNLAAALFTRHGDSLNQRAVNLHMLEDVLGWLVVLIGAVLIKLTGFLWIDPVLSAGVAVFILAHAIKNMQEILHIFLEKTPDTVDIEELKDHIKHIEEVIDVHHIHVWSMDGQNNYATMHIVTSYETYEVRQKIREELRKHGICHVTLELEKAEDPCNEKKCQVTFQRKSGHHRHHAHAS